MRVLDEAPDRLLMEQRPLAVALGLGGGLAAVAAAGLASTHGPGDLPATLTGVVVLGLGLSVALERASLALDRSEGVVRLERVGVFGGSTLARPLSALRGADVESARDENGQLTRHRLILHFAGAPDVPACRAFAGGDGAARAAEAVNRWLRRSRWQG